MRWPWRRKGGGEVESMELKSLDRRQQAILSRLPVALRTEVMGELPMTVENKRRQVDDITAQLEAMVERLYREAEG